MANDFDGTKFASFLVTQTPYFDKYIIEDVRPTDGEIGHFATAVWPAFSETEHTKDRFHSVFPNVTKEWVRKNSASCSNAPCDPVEHSICWGNTRITYYKERQSWKTDLLCFDQIRDKTHAKEHFRQIISKILRPATGFISSHFLRKRACESADSKWLANGTMAPFTFSFVTVGDEEIYMDSDGIPTSKLTPQMLQNVYSDLLLDGYMGENPFKDMPPLVELVTDMDTVFGLDRAAGDSTSPLTVAERWRFQDWGDAQKYYKYAFRGQIGNYVCRADPFPLRFNYQGVVGGKYRFQVVLPYRNTAATNGLKSIKNPDWKRARYQFSRISHMKGLQLRVGDATPVNSEMPFSARDLGGKWTFAMHDLGSDTFGRPIENKRNNKGMFLADFEYAIEPLHTEFLHTIFHEREPACVIQLAPCAADPGYPVQYYSSACNPCTFSLEFTPTLCGVGGTYKIAANTITCSAVPIVHAAINAATLALLASALNTNVSILGTWAATASTITLSGSPCGNVGITWLTVC